MKRKILGICAVLLGACLLLTACSGGGSGGGGQATNTITPGVSGEVEGNMHSYSMKETGKYIVQGGKSQTTTFRRR